MFLPDSTTRGVGGFPTGRVGSTVYSHGPHGSYSYPYQPHVDLNSAYQQAQRLWFRQASERWKLIPESLRLPWYNYAANVPYVTRAGVRTFLSAYQRYVGHLAFLGQTQSIAFNPDRAPAVFNNALLSPSTFVPWGGLFVIVWFHLADPWRHVGYGSGFVLFASRPQKATVNHFTGPFRYVRDIAGDPVVPPASMFATLPFFPYGTNRRIFFRTRVVDRDRLSVPLVQYLDFP